MGVSKVDISHLTLPPRTAASAATKICLKPTQMSHPRKRGITTPDQPCQVKCDTAWLRLSRSNDFCENASPSPYGWFERSSSLAYLREMLDSQDQVQCDFRSALTTRATRAPLEPNRQSILRGVIIVMFSQIMPFLTLKREATMPLGVITSPKSCKFGSRNRVDILM